MQTKNHATFIIIGIALIIIGVIGYCFTFDIAIALAGKSKSYYTFSYDRTMPNIVKAVSIIMGIGGILTIIYPILQEKK